MKESNEEIASIFRKEYSNLVAVLCRFYGVENMHLAEDVVSGTFLQAMKAWSHKGIPSQPKAWLRKVATNKVKDHYRREHVFRDKAMPSYAYKTERSQLPTVLEFSKETIEDSQLNMIFTVCDPAVKIEGQICLALRILCGFNVEEIASALITNKENVNKRLYRSKQKLKEVKKEFKELERQDYIERIDAVLRVIYLIFNEGYASVSSDVEIKYDLCWEAMRLCLFLVDQKDLNLPRVNALLALMCFHASRLNARVDQSGNMVLYDDQNRDLWDQALIKKGETYLSISVDGNNVSKYHIEAAIAYWHTTDHSHKWESILQLYNKLLTIEYSPYTAMNRTFALAKANSVKEAIKEAKKLDLKKSHLYNTLMAELYRLDGDTEQAIQYLTLAIKSVKSKSQLDVLKKKMMELKNPYL